jgi:acyl-CoA synthetase (AMP-forming)/AMP-acid ligase II
MIATPWNYAELTHRVGCVAGGYRRAVLRTRRPGHAVHENCAEFLEMLFACWAAGLCGVPVDARLHLREAGGIHSPRFGLSADRCNVRGCRDAGAAREPSANHRDWQELDYARLLTGEPVCPAVGSSTGLTWLFYTSGTTGRPKGAGLSHRNLLFMSHCYYADIGRVDERDTNLHATPLSHGAGLYALPHLLRGSHQVVLPHFRCRCRDRRCLALSAAVDVRRTNDADMPVQAPAVANADWHNLRTICYGGGPMYVADLERALDLFGARLYQLYGQGESPMTITGLSKRVHMQAVEAGRRDRLDSCGVARTGVLVKVIDENDRELSPGETAEVITRSDCVMGGYWRNPEANAKALRGGWLHTGDLGSLDEEGFLSPRDRSKDIIISGGSNIYPREIGEVLMRHSALMEVLVMGRAHPEWGEEVLAFVVARPGAELSPQALDRLCLDHIARFKRPRHYALSTRCQRTITARY